MGSTRLPGKTLKKIGDMSILEYGIRRIKLSKKVDKIVVATTIEKIDDEIKNLCKQINIDCFRGESYDVLSRYYQCSLNYPEYNNILRITGDCPLIDPSVIDDVVLFFENNKYDYVSNILEETFPDGMDVEIFTKKSLEKSNKEAKLQSEREHVTLYIRNSDQFAKGNLSSEINWSHFRLTVDEQKDFEVIEFLIKNSKINASFLDYISILTKNPDIMFKNMHIIRNEGLRKSLENDFIINNK